MPTPNLPAILDKIIGALRENTLPTGTELTEGEIAKILALSRSTVRLAMNIIVKAQQECLTVTYHPPRGAQRSLVIFAGLGGTKKSEAADKSEEILPQAKPRKISLTPTTESIIICPRCKARQPFKEAWRLHTSGAEVACEGCGLDLRKIVEHWSEASGE